VNLRYKAGAGCSDRMSITDITDLLIVSAIGGVLFWPVDVGLMSLPWKHTASWLVMGYVFLVLALAQIFTEKPRVKFWTYFQYMVISGLVFGFFAAASGLVTYLLACHFQPSSWVCFNRSNDIALTAIVTGVYIVLSATTYTSPKERQARQGGRF
jgi:hypothetical protein